MVTQGADMQTDRDIFKTLSNIYDGAFCKKNNAYVKVHGQNFFRAIGHFDKDFIKNIRKRCHVW